MRSDGRAASIHTFVMGLSLIGSTHAIVTRLAVVDLFFRTNELSRKQFMALMAGNCFESDGRHP